MKITHNVKTSLAAGLVGFGTILAMQALAQLPAGVSNPNSGAAMLKSATGGCQGLIDQVTALLGSFQGAAKSSILGEVTQAKSSLSAGNETGCMSHANKAMSMLK